MFSNTAGDDEDEDFLPITSSTKLAALFDNSGPLSSRNSTLTYTAPKQPGTNISMQQSLNTSTPQAAQPMSAICVAAVTGYMLKGEKYELIPGKVGFALLGNSELKSYQLVLYQGKQKPIATAKVTEDFSITSQPNNFCSFYDDRQQNWAVMFDSKELATKFHTEIDLVKAKLKGRPQQTIQQEVRPEVKEPQPLKEPEPKEATKKDTETIDKGVEDKKAKLLSRMAKMGQPILPLPGAPVAQPSSSSEEETKTSPEPIVPPIRSKVTRKPRVASPVENIQSGPVVSTTYGHVPNYPFVQYIPQPTVSVTPNNSLLEALISETRTQNSEIRMHLMRLTDKLDLVLQKGPTVSTHSSPEVESLCRAQSSKLDEVLNLLKNKTDSSTLEKERDTWRSRCNESQQEIARLQNQLASYESANRQDKTAELQCEIGELREKLTIYETNYAEMQKNNHQMHIWLQTEREERALLQGQLERAEKGRSMAESLAETLQRTLEEKENALKSLETRSPGPRDSTHVNEEIKKIMNVVYKKLLKEFQPDETYDYAVIKSSISTIIREVTLSMLRNDEPDAEMKESNETEEKSQSTHADTEDSKAAETQNAEANSSESEKDSGNEPNEVKDAAEVSRSLEETIGNTLAASLSNPSEQMWKPDPPPPPLFDDMDSEDGWLI